MKSKNIIAIFILCIFTNIAQAQKPTWYLSQQVGVFLGDNKTKPIATLSTGVQTKTNWYMGVNAGIDFYVVNSIPLTFDIKKTFVYHKITGIVYVNPGLNIVKPTNAQRSFMLNNWSAPSKVKNGIFVETGVGAVFLKSKKLFATVGFSRKTFAAEYDRMLYDPNLQQTIMTTSTDKYAFNRIIIKLGYFFTNNN